MLQCKECRKGWVYICKSSFLQSSQSPCISSTSMKHFNPGVLWFQCCHMRSNELESTAPSLSVEAYWESCMQHSQKETELVAKQFYWRSSWRRDLKEWTLPIDINTLADKQCNKRNTALLHFCSIPTMMSMMALGTLCFSTVEVWLSICEMLQFDLVFPEMRCSVNKWYHCNSKEYKHWTRCVCSFWLPEQ